MVEIEGLTLAYSLPAGDFIALADASASFKDNELTAIVGPSGSGKTSLLKAMACLIAPVAGSIRIAGLPLSGVRERTAFIFQDSGLLPWKTVRENAELPLRIRGIPARERHARVEPILEELGLSEFASFYPARLSGGMRQRLGVARALAQDADLFLMDEPFSSLDALTRESLQDGLLALRARHPVTVILVTHSIEEAAYLADRVYLVAGRAPGRMAGFIDWSAARAKVDGATQAAPTSRSDPAFFARCAELRQAFESAVASASGGAA
jgi:NitT/TauT family transport system ATP-binding protein